MDRTVGPREALGAGIIALGVLAILMPLIVDQLPMGAADASPQMVLAGMSILIGIFVIVAGIASFTVKD
jgi:hypothetical protein